VSDDPEAASAAVDVGEYCRQVEAHLARVNAGEIIRITGAGFELVRGWALEGMPLSVVCHGIALKAERHRAGRATRPLRIEFCTADVRDVYARWRRAVGLPAAMAARRADADAGTGEAAADTGSAAEERRRPSMARHLQRAIDRLSAAVSRTDLAPPMRDALEGALEELARLAETARGARGPARDALAASLALLDRRMLAGVRAATEPAELERIAAEAARDLVVYRGRVSPDVWQRSIDLGVNRQLRDELGLPVLEIS
jgi:hypothetical protein